jgi:hypothetical protein
MADLGKDFKAPRRRNAAQWRKIEILVAAGITFDSCGCSGPGPRPDTWREAVEFVSDRYRDALDYLAEH